MRLEHYLIRSTERHPGALAVRAPDGDLSYEALDTRADGLALALSQLGVRAGDRVAIWLEKSQAGVIATQAILRLGAAYVPVDPGSPPERVGRILADCGVAALVTSSARRDQLASGADLPPLFLVDERAIPEGAPAQRSPDPSEDALAYILYTSGSTGTPKGVCISHRNATAFVEWAVQTLEIGPSDRLSNHAPFHFDLSVLDLYGAFAAGASVHLIPEQIATLPARLMERLQRDELTLWYSVPSVLILMIEQAGLLETELSHLRAICFAGEPFPTKYVARLRERWPALRLLNLYGPTETNVCTYHEVGPGPIDDRPLPIGVVCSGDRAWAQRPDGGRAELGEEGELIVEGPTVMLGYWGQLPQDGPYPTGDIVRVEAEGRYALVGRRDHMMKIRGHRVEPGEIEAALATHPGVREVAAVVQGKGMEARLVAHIVTTDPSAPPRLLALRQHAAARLPRYMIPHQVEIHPVDLPRTSTGKADRAHLALPPAKRSTRHAASP